MRVVNATPTVRNADDPAAIAEAAELIRAGRLVAFPTETVYGLGANALDPAAVARVFEAKGRPATNPLIVHVANVEAARELAADWPPVADRLAERFWPGPLTLVVEKNARVPDIVTANGPTVGVRVPAHRAALALLKAAGVPIAAPSANRSEEVSPTTAQHVVDSLGDRVDLILDGGPSNVGIESTVLDVTQTPPRLLRPGMVSETMLRAVVSELAADNKGSTAGASRSPGQHARHYAPRKPLLVFEEPVYIAAPGDAFLQLPRDADAAGAMLYAELRRLDADPNVHRILAVLWEKEGPKWTAIHDRLRRAAVPKDDAS